MDIESAGEPIATPEGSQVHTSRPQPMEPGDVWRGPVEGEYCRST